MSNQPDTRTGIEQLDALPEQFREGGGPRAADMMACIILQVHDEYAAEIRKAEAKALREAAPYAAGGLHCADMFVAPYSTIKWLRERADRIEAG